MVFRFWSCLVVRLRWRRRRRGVRRGSFVRSCVVLIVWFGGSWGEHMFGVG